MSSVVRFLVCFFFSFCSTEKCPSVFSHKDMKEIDALNKVSFLCDPETKIDFIYEIFFCVKCDHGDP